MRNTTTLDRIKEGQFAKYLRKKNVDSFRHKYSLGRTERKRLVRETNVYALVLFEHYLRIASTEDVLISDQGAADYFDWSLTTAKRWRLALVKAGWFLTKKTRSTTGEVVHIYYLGKDEVKAAGREPKDEAVKRTRPPLIVCDDIAPPEDEL